MLIFLNALVLYFYHEHVQRITFCRCFLIFNPAVFCVDDGVILWLKIKNPTTTTQCVLKKSFIAVTYAAITKYITKAISVIDKSKTF